MGWSVIKTSFNESSRALRVRLENEIIESQRRAGNQVLKCSKRANRTWLLLATPHGDKWIGLILWDMSGSSVGYKLLDETVHTFYYDCPLGFLKQAPEKSAEWRMLVQQKAARRRRFARLIPGARIVLKKGCKIDGGGRMLTYIGHRKFGQKHWICGETTTGKRYRVPSTQILTTIQL